MAVTHTWHKLEFEGEELTLPFGWLVLLLDDSSDSIVDELLTLMPSQINEALEACVKNLNFNKGLSLLRRRSEFEVDIDVNRLGSQLLERNKKTKATYLHDMVLEDGSSAFLHEGLRCYHLARD